MGLVGWAGWAESFSYFFILLYFFFENVSAEEEREWAAGLSGLARWVGLVSIFLY